ncbi:helix-turn-helix transcriptional regulator [Streptomyces sp. XD-27]|uniref:helix-turn-helix domain-containing protein n=1 Tax=Streptomyces sp. XD-27 TaxID=3062779 RepID=UPI0026F44791|nr:helix-turn-helix transcriptional regulator [Streptomyces sp. XD-27]WKX70877.1 helix-turn-helix transcriptional regulator [Streptomyces sp. XD-27]
MARWTALSGELPSEVRHLVEQLRRLKDRTGLSLVALADKTAYSKSSWQRYLNGQKMPPRQAVLALGTVAGADPRRLTVLWELADAAWLRDEPCTGEGERARDREAPEPPGAAAEPPPAEAAEAPPAEAPAEAPRDVPGDGPAPAPAPARRWGRLTAVLLAGVGVLAAVGGAAAAFGDRDRDRTEEVKRCRAVECSNRDPAAYDCHDDRKRLTQARVRQVGLRIWYSARCHAAWGEMEAEEEAQAMSLFIESEHGSARTLPATDGVVRTMMLATALPDRVRLVAAIAGGDAVLLGSGEQDFLPTRDAGGGEPVNRSGRNYPPIGGHAPADSGQAQPDPPRVPPGGRLRSPS